MEGCAPRSPHAGRGRWGPGGRAGHLSHARGGARAWASGPVPRVVSRRGRTSAPGTGRNRRRAHSVLSARSASTVPKCSPMHLRRGPVASGVGTARVPHTATRRGGEDVTEARLRVPRLLHASVLTRPQPAWDRRGTRMYAWAREHSLTTDPAVARSPSPGPPTPTDGARTAPAPCPEGRSSPSMPACDGTTCGRADRGRTTSARGAHGAPRRYGATAGPGRGVVRGRRPYGACHTAAAILRAVTVPATCTGPHSGDHSGAHPKSRWPPERPGRGAGPARARGTRDRPFRCGWRSIPSAAPSESPSCGPGRADTAYGFIVYT